MKALRGRQRDREVRAICGIANRGREGGAYLGTGDFDMHAEFRGGVGEV